MIQTGRLIVYKTIFTARHEHEALMSDSHLSNISLASDWPVTGFIGKSNIIYFTS